jgi:TolA-binding protein
VTPRATSWALAALIQYARAVRLAPEKYTLAVSVNGKVVQRLAIDSNAATTTIEVPAALLTAPRARVAFDLEGRGTYTYSAVLTGFTDEGLLDDETLKRQQDEGTASATGPLSVRRTYTQAARIWDGKAVPRGFSTVTNIKSWQNLATEIGMGQHVQVNLSWSADSEAAIDNYIVVREPLPSGTRALEASIQGSFERYEIGEGEITFFFYRNRYGSASYDLYGAQPGHYRVLPTKVWAFGQPDLYAHGTFKDLRVLRRDEAGKDEYRLTPDEIYFLGKAHFDRAQEAIAGGEAPKADDLKAAGQYLTDLFNRDADPKGWKLREEPGRQTARMLFTLALHRDDATNTVRFFEVLRERYPSLVIPFKEIVQTARAYGQMGEREREVQVLRTTAEASFGREALVAGVLAEEGEHRASYSYLAARAQEYPDLANVESSLYALAQTISQRAEQMREGGSREESRELAKLAADTLRDFLALYAENPVGDEASFAYAVNLIEREQFAQAAAWCARSLARYPDSAYADDYTYIATYAGFLGERFDDALKMAQELATKEYTQEDGSKAQSSYRPFALYIAAQIHHARGQTGEAVKFYQLVAEQFPDARESADFFQSKTLKMPELVAVTGNEPARLKLTSRNVGTVQVAVYKVDLMKFYQDRQNLLDLGQMNLAGIKPMWQTSVKVGEKEFVDRETTVPLPVAEKGAYFVTVKAADGDGRPQVAGVVVRSELALEVQEDAVSGRVRVNVMNREERDLQPKAEVWVIGSDNDTFRKGTTDLRGLVAVDDVRGRATIIAYKDGDYAFYRGETILQPQLVRPATIVNAPANQQPNQAGQQNFKDQARNMYNMNQRQIEKKNEEYLRNVVNVNKGGANMGVAVGSAY